MNVLKIQVATLQSKEDFSWFLSPGEGSRCSYYIISCYHGLIFCLNGHNVQVFTLLVCTTVTDSIHLLEIYNEQLHIHLLVS